MNFVAAAGRQIADIMTKSVAVVQRDETLQAAALRMREMDIGALPVCDGKALVGMVTDRDITVRGVAAGMLYARADPAPRTADAA